ncbi:hypothetical protein GCM10027343_16890 [Noviherbaspirillum agri]
MIIGFEVPSFECSESRTRYPTRHKRRQFADGSYPTIVASTVKSERSNRAKLASDQLLIRSSERKTMAELNYLIARAFDETKPLRIQDALVRVLWRVDANQPWPELTFPEMTAAASQLMDYPVGQPTVRGIVYRNPEIFEKVESDSYSPRWRICRACRSKR